MITVGSISGGKTSAYMEVHFPSDLPIFSLVRIDDRDCLWMEGKDEKTRQLISDRIGCEFVGTAEMDEIIYTILDLEQFLGREIKIITGPSFEKVIEDAKFIPNRLIRRCTIKMKLEPIFNYLNSLNILPVEMNIGYRFNESTRIENIRNRADENGFEHFNDILYRKVNIPLEADRILKHEIYSFWYKKPVRFAYRNNCMMCVNRNPLMISHVGSKDIRKLEWASKIEKKRGNTFLLDGISMEKIMSFAIQGNLFDDEDFSDCDSGYCLN